jgi:hypothetical protein
METLVDSSLLILVVILLENSQVSRKLTNTIEPFAIAVYIHLESIVTNVWKKRLWLENTELE